MSHRGPSTVSSISNASQQHATALQRETNRQLVRSRMRFCTFCLPHTCQLTHRWLAFCDVGSHLPRLQVEATRVDRIVEIVERLAGASATSACGHAML